MTRRSYRLKNKPSPSYVYPSFRTTFLKLEPTAQLSAEETTKKYEDIFSAVVANAFTMDIQPTPEPPFERTFRKKRQYRKRKVSEDDSDKTSTDDNDDDDDDVIIVMEKKKKDDDVVDDDDDDIIEIDIFGCACGMRFENHSDCHKHIAEQHGDNESNVECLKCGHRLNDIRTNNMCHICGKYCEHLEEHVISHYRNCTAKSAVMECRFCTKQFITVKEVMEHEKQKHLTKGLVRPKPLVRCNVCSVGFPTYEYLSQHYSTHFDVNLIFDRIADIQIRSRAEKEECPFCRGYVASRKIFRAHVLNKHYTAAISLIQPPPVDQSLVDAERIKRDIEQMLQQFPETSPVKQEVKEEVHDDEYPQC